MNREVCHIVMKCPNVCQIGKEPATGLQPDNRFISSRSGMNLFLYACKRIHISEAVIKSRLAFNPSAKCLMVSELLYYPGDSFEC